MGASGLQMERQMTQANSQNFDKRMERILRKHQRMSHGYVPVLTEDGLIVPAPKRRPVRLPLRLIAFTLIGLMAFKIMLFVSIGDTAYEARVATLQAGSQWEQVGAWIMSADPVTVWAAEQIALLKP
jgi:hypothetical protein